MLTYFAKKVFGTKNSRILKSIKPLVLRVNELEAQYAAMSDDELKAQTGVFKERLAQGEHIDTIEPDAFAVVREASKRVLNMRHFDVQLIGGAVLHRGMIAEMKTGEGKTLVATLPSYLNALTGKGVHVVTVNDYLARRDAEWMGQIHRFLGLSVGVVFHGMRDDVKRAAYKSDITYGQNNEFGFDYLRDNMKFRPEDIYQQGHHFAIVDEVDSILIDEARTPLIISGPAEEATDKYAEINKIIPSLRKDEHYETDLKSKQPTLTEAGVLRAEELLGVDNLYAPQNIETLHHVVQGLRAHTTLERDVDYVVKEGQIIIVDEFTGRLMPGRRWSNGLHQAVEAKEGMMIARENQTLASITFQNFFRMYQKLSGMTGTADTEAAEFKHIYSLDVVVIPPNRIMVREDASDVVYRTKKEKFDSVVNDIKEANTTGQPILVGTISIEQSEALSKILAREDIKHNVLNAKHHEKEAEIVAQAGRFSAVTIATNMAGRGTDILLGGNPEFLAAAEAGTKDKNDPAFQEAFKKFAVVCSEEKAKVIAAGGLFIMGTERHESRRIDNQLRGRAGRQGDPGKSRFYVSFEDDLMLRFGMDRFQAIMNRVGWEEGTMLDGRLISSTIETAQKRVESYHFESRKHVTEYDDVMNKQRQVIYNQRNRILANEDMRDEVLSMIDDLLEEAVVQHCDERVKPLEWDLKAVSDRAAFLCNTKLEFPSDMELDAQKIFDLVRGEARNVYLARVQSNDAKLAEIETISKAENGSFSVSISRVAEKPMNFGTVEQDTMLESLDHYWNVHLQEMDYLREGIGLRGYGQKNPLYEYQKEGFLLFQQMLDLFKEAVVRKLFYYEVPDPQALIAHIEAEKARRAQLEKNMEMIHESPEGGAEDENESAAAADAKHPEDQRAKMLQQKKDRRKARR